MKITQQRKIHINERKIKGEKQDLYDYIKNAVISLNDVLSDLYRTINSNAERSQLRYKAQDSAPTVDEKELLIWKDTGAGSGAPTHFLIYNDSGTYIIFSSDQTARL